MIVYAKIMIVYKKYSNFDSKPLLCIACSFTEVIPVVFAAKSHGPGTVNMSEIAYFALSEAKKKVAEFQTFSDFHYFAS